MPTLAFRMLARLLVATALCITYGCASPPQAGSEGRPAVVQVYAVNPYVGRPYEAIGPLWAGSWRSAFRLPTYPTTDEAIAALQTEATRLNADALINVSCLDQGRSTWFKSTEPGFLCYGVAIRLGRSQG
jgi:hypothetical protein